MTDNNITIAAEDRGLAVITHLSGLAGYVIPFCGIAVPIIIWAVKSESAVISSIAKQAILLNIAVFVLGIATFLMVLTIILIPVAIVCWIVLGVLAVALPIVGAIKANQGAYYKYPVVGTSPS